MSTYSKHQRDYTLLGTSITFEAFMNARTSAYFGFEAAPMFVAIENGILSHYHTSDDALNRAKNWMQKYGSIEALKDHHTAHNKILVSYREFLTTKHTDQIETLTKLHTYFEELLPVALVAIELPEILDQKKQKDLFEECMQIRKENEDIYKVGMDLQNTLTTTEERLLSAAEFRTYAETRTLPANINQRSTFFLLEHSTHGERSWNDPSAMHDLRLEGEVDHTVDTFSGKTAFAGKVSGRVRVIKKVEDAKNLEEGEILVTSMTDPRYVPLMKKAAAIVTDEGGITCHAAIMSRELKKPCIIGTKVATKILKDGDEVEVDANTGKITILKRAV